MCHYRLVFLFAFIVFHTHSTKAQQSFTYSFRHITQADGLLHNDVLSIVQDGKGFIWIATPNGLQRYDGSRFIYYPEMLSSPAEGFTYGAEMYADKKNNLLWISNTTSIEKMELGKNQFTVYDPETLLKDPSFVFDSYREVNNEKWLLGNHAVYKYDSSLKRNTMYRLNIFPENSHQASFTATDNTGNNTWVVGMSQLFLFNKKNNSISSDNDNPSGHPLLEPSLYGKEGKFLRFIMIDSRQNTWVTTWDDILYKYDNVTKKLNRYSLAATREKEFGSKAPVVKSLVNCILEDDNHVIWIGTENAGLLRYDSVKDNFDYCIPQEKNNEGIRYDYKIFSLLQDKEQNIWIGTDKGISIFNPYRQYFRTTRHEENNPLSIGKSEIISFTQTANGDIFIGTWGGGMALYDSEFHFKKNILFKGPIETNFIWSFMQVDEKTLWIGCQHGYLLIYDMLTGAVQTLHPPEMKDFTIRCMEKDDKGNILFGLHNGKITKWDKQQDKFFPYGTSAPDSLTKADAVFNIFIDRSQQCWVSTEDGFKRFDMEKMVYTNKWIPDKNNTKAIWGRPCRGIEEYNDSTLLIGTIYGGLNFFNKRTNTFSHLSVADGLPSNSIYAIKKDTEGYIWFTTDYGFYKFDPVEKKSIPYSVGAGLINSPMLSSRFYPLQDGQWLTFTTSEAIRFFPYTTDHRQNGQPKVEITGFNLFDKPLFIDSLLLENAPIRLSYKENFFTVEFAALNFSGMQQTSYYYRLNGVDKEWVHGGTKRFANYTDLHPGEYTFDVKAENGNGSGETTSFKIIITPPFWLTWWFIAASITVVCFTVFWLLRRRFNVIRREAQMRQTIAETEMMALRAQMNPHFIFNCLNAIDNLIQTNQKEKATTYLARFAKLIRSVLDSSRNNMVPFQNDYESLQLYLQMEQFRCNNKFTYELNAAEELLHSDYKLPPLIIQPFVENAIHHGLLNKQTGERKLIVSAIVENDVIKYTVTDNGVGRKKAQEIKELNKPEHRSYGINITQERIQLYNRDAKTQDISITDLTEEGQPAGTKVEIRLKIHDNNKYSYA